MFDLALSTEHSSKNCTPRANGCIMNGGSTVIEFFQTVSRLSRWIPPLSFHPTETSNQRIDNQTKGAAR
jgi:hypothetical protein